MTPIPGSYAYWCGTMLATLRIIARETGNPDAIYTLKQFAMSDLANDKDKNDLADILVSTAGGSRA